MKKFIAFIVIILATLSIIYGGIKPYKKASLYVDAVKSNPLSIQEFLAVFKKAFDYPSPVGQDELIRFTSGDVLDVIASGKNDEAISRALVDFLHQYTDKKIESGVGMNYSQMIMMIGNIHLNEWKIYKNPDDLAKAIHYFEQGYAINHDRPQFLIGLLELYQESGQKEKAAAIQQHIMELWDVQ